MTGRLNNQIASAQGIAQAEVHRREKAEGKLDRALAALANLRTASFAMADKLVVAQSIDDYPPHIQAARTHLRYQALTAEGVLRHLNHTPTTRPETTP